MPQKEKITFLPEEKKLFEIEHHPIVVFPHIFFSIIILLLDFFLMYYLFLQGWWGVILFGAVLFIAIFYLLRMIFLWKKNKVVITNQRILDFEQVDFFEHYLSEFNLSEIKSVEISNRGILPKILGFGNLQFVFLDNQIPFEIYKVKKPLLWQQKITVLLENRKKDLPTSAVELLTDEIDKLKPEEKAEIYKKLAGDLPVNNENLDN